MRKLSAATCVLLAFPVAALAQHRDGTSHGSGDVRGAERHSDFRGGGGPHGGGVHGGLRGVPGESGLRSRFAPGPIARFRPRDIDAWRGGYWWHGFRGGRIGWWWFAGGAWYWYAAPAYPYPGYVADDYLPGSGAPGGVSYLCSYPAGYYPHVRACPSGWRMVPAYGPGPP